MPSATIRTWTITAQATKQLPLLAAGGGVKAGRGLIEENEIGIADDAKRQLQPEPLNRAPFGLSHGAPVQLEEVDRVPWR